MKDKNQNTNNAPIKIALGDLRHRTIGKHSSFMPVGIAYIGSYALSQMGPQAVQVRLYDNPGAILKDIKEWKPDVLALSNYCWNSELSRTAFRYAKNTNPNTVCVSGGPNFPTDHIKCKKYLSERPEIDFYTYFEAEVSFANLVKNLHKGKKISDLKKESQLGIMSIHPQTKELVWGAPAPRLMNMDEIPSPYLTGLMDQWFDGSYVPAVETARGCPFTCQYCFVGSQEYYSRVAFFSVGRIKKEFRYIAQRITKYNDIPLAMFDSSFGLYERDEQIAHYIRVLQDEYDWPNFIDVTTANTNYDRILKIATILKNKMPVTCSVQSFNPKTLAVVKRRNPATDEYLKVNAEIKKRGMSSVTEAIVPMPEETKKSFFEGLKMVIDVIGVDRVVPFTTMLLQGTYLESEECRKKHGMQTKFRVVPRQFGEYFGQKCFEIEEVCIATNTMLFEEYLDIRGFGVISAFFIGKQFDVIDRHLKELGISKYDFFYHLWELIKSGKTALSETYSQFIEETRGELWESREAIYDYFKEPANYEKLLKGELGDNLLRKYLTKLFLEASVSSIELVYEVIANMAQKAMTDKVRESLRAAKAWMIACRDVSAVFKSDPDINISKTLNLPFDVDAWYSAGANSNPLISYCKPVDYQIFCDTGRFKMIPEAKKLYGGDFAFQIGQILVNWDIENFWRQCKALKS